MNHQEQTTEVQKADSRFATFLRHSAGLKIGVIGLIILILLIPAGMIRSLIHERQMRRDAAVHEMSEKWGATQLISGPVLTVPVETKKYYTEEKPIITKEYLHFLPQRLDIKSNLTPQLRHRGIFTASLYSTTVDITGVFAPAEADKMQVAPEDIQWDKAFLTIGMSDMAGVRQQLQGTINEKKVEITPGIDTQDVFSSGVSIPYPCNQTEELSFRFQMELNGSNELLFLPLGQSTTVELQSSWHTPSFTGRFLPVDYTVTDDGFSAKWQVSHFNRDYPQSWKGSRGNLNTSAFGVKIMQATDIYQKTTRTSKYALMFIVFSFTAFFLAEILTKSRLHPIQYILVGFAITCFYVLLLAFSEHIGFNSAYTIAATAVVLLIGTYTRCILGATMSLVTTLLLCCLYSYLFVTLQLEDYALLMGSIGLFVLLGLVMFLTRKIDWYGLHQA